MKRIAYTILFLLFTVSLAAGASTIKQEKGAIWAASDGRGTVSLFWVPANAVWPQGGWQLERVSGGKTSVIAQKIMPGSDAEAMRLLDPKEADGLRKFAAEMKAGSLNPDEAKLAGAILGLKAATDQAFGRALGLRFSDTGAGSALVSYRLIALDASGRKGVVLQSATIDPRRSTSLPDQVKDLKIVQEDETVRLSWSPPAVNREMPVIAYHVERSAEGKTETLTQTPLLISAQSAKQKQSPPVFLDSTPPVETTITYYVSGVDLLGRKSAPVPVEIFMQDISALQPPEQVLAKAGDNRVDVTWKPNKSRYTAMYVVERSFLYDGPYETLTPEGLKQGENSYKDKTVRGGTTYYYRVRSIGPRGDPGHPSSSVMAQPQNGDRPPTPEKLTADAGRTRIKLTWEMVRFPVAGYFIERRGEGKKWARMNGQVIPEPRYEDSFGQQNGGRYTYRVVAVGFDNKESSPGEEVSVTLPDTVPPSVPRITRLSSVSGKVIVEFEPAAPGWDTDQFLVLRSLSDKEPGLVIGEPLPSKARKFEDAFVEAGQVYWYRMVAVDNAGNRSDPSTGEVISAAGAVIPVPRKPVVKLIREPFSHVEISFDAPPAELGIVLLVKAGDSKPWVVIDGPLYGTRAVDANPPHGDKIFYCIVYRAADGAEGRPSEAAGISVP